MQPDLTDATAAAKPALKLLACCSEGGGWSKPRMICNGGCGHGCFGSVGAGAAGGVGAGVRVAAFAVAHATLRWVVSFGGGAAGGAGAAACVGAAAFALTAAANHALTAALALCWIVSFGVGPAGGVAAGRFLCAAAVAFAAAFAAANRSWTAAQALLGRVRPGRFLPEFRTRPSTT